VILLIPSYEPNEQLISLVGAIRSAHADLSIVVVNDGSDPSYAPIFQAIASDKVTVVSHHKNFGKGRALKTGFAHIAATYPGADVVCADSDGQHQSDDIMRVGDALHGLVDTIVLGTREFSGIVPLKSRLGNRLTRLVYRVATGRRLRDTQTGLRAYPASMLPWLQAIDGDRFEYEMSVLLDADRAGYAVEEVAIDTVYLNGNASTHFRPIIDSARVYIPLVKFGLSSFAAFLLDLVLLFTFTALFGRLLTAVILARFISSVANFLINRSLVFGHTHWAALAHAAARYFSLAIGILAVNYALLHVLYHRIGLPLLAAKLVTEVGLFAIGFQVQRRFVFNGQHVTGG
jgi:glycosyltransferase involved in cell wall biosynthesis